jgi:hypothetical protein
VTTGACVNVPRLAAGEQATVELRSTGEARAPAPTWFVALQPAMPATGLYAQ